jgi:hypothetical protein
MDSCVCSALFSLCWAPVQFDVNEMEITAKFLWDLHSTATVKLQDRLLANVLLKCQRKMGSCEWIIACIWISWLLFRSVLYWTVICSPIFYSRGQISPHVHRRPLARTSSANPTQASGLKNNRFLNSPVSRPPLTGDFECSLLRNRSLFFTKASCINVHVANMPLYV